VDRSASRVPYDELSMFHENAEELGIPFDGPPAVRRERVALGDGRHLSCLVWRERDPQLVFLHGGAQNAHTWDSVLLALGHPALAVDLPGHGHSDGGRDGYLDVEGNAADVEVAVRALAPGAAGVVGMSLGGLTLIALAARAPDLVRNAVLVDITPGVTSDKSAAITSFVEGPESFPDFDAILARTVEFNPTRSVASLRRGILHNAVQRDDGSWVWRYARHRLPAGVTRARPDFAGLWDALGRIQAPLMLVRGMAAQSVVDDADEAELRRRLPAARVEHVAGAGHSVQGDAPLELAALIDDFIGPGHKA
jgi:pimeloyl-ACP methyl ester carboxylesterase